MSSHAASLPHDAAHSGHPTDLTYIKIAAILTAITIAEVAIYYIHALRSILVPALIIMSVVKFITVVAYFMHLKFDDKRLALIFSAAMGLSLLVIGALVTLHRFHYIDYATNFLTARD